MSYTSSSQTADCAESLSHAYRITIERKRNPAIGSAVTFIMIINGRPRPLADGGAMTFECNQTCFEIPVAIIKNARKKFEGVLAGVADGNDIHIVWDVDLTSETLGAINETTNNTVSFRKNPGATRW